jgi:hypothetical protein
MADLPKLPGIPSITSVQDTTVAAILRPVKESLEILSSAISGNPLPNGNVITSGFNTAISNGAITVSTEYNGTTDYTPPPTPSGFSIGSGFTNIILTWNDPGSETYLNHAYTEVWRATTNVLGNAELQGFAPGATYVDPVGTSKTYYYWIRFVSQANVDGPYNASTGTVGGTGLVGGVDLGPLIVDATKLAANAVESGKIADYAITTTKIANLAVGNAAIANLAVNNAKIADLAVDDAKIANLGVGKLTAGSISTGEYIKSTNYSSGVNGWYIGGNGVAEFGAASIRGQITAAQIDSRSLTIRDAAGNIILGAGTALNYANITPSTSWLNSNITISSNGTLNGAGGGTVSATGLGAVKTDLTNAPSGILNSSVSLGTLGAGAFAYLNAITSANVSSYIASAAIGSAQIGTLTAGNIGANTIDAGKMAANSITAGNAALGDASVSTLKIQNQAVSIVTVYSSTQDSGDASWRTSYTHTFPISVSMPIAGAIAIVCTVANRGAFDNGYSYYSTTSASITSGSSFSGGGYLAGTGFTIMSQGEYGAGTHTFNVACTAAYVYNPGFTATAIIIRTFR